MPRVTLLHAPAARTVHEQALDLRDGATVADALAAAGLAALVGDGGFSVGIWGRKAAADQELREGDRLEVVRALQVDPKVARRERFRRQGARGTGLFARKAPGATPEHDPPGTKLPQ
jgi:putative ubiquitin-RnfH superfamily antitoxin RatB of RatAB toxin-antitoxin module